MIAITGATGFVGFHLLKLLRQKGILSVALTRSGSPRRSRVEALGIPCRETDFENEASIERALAGCDAMIHMIGIVNGPEESLRKVNVAYTRRLVERARKAGMRRVLFMSSVAAAGRHGPYGQTKFEAEELVCASGLPYLVFRSAFIYGEGDELNMKFMMSTLKKFPVIPLLGGGDFRLQPVYVEDVVSLLVRALAGTAVNRIYNVAGPRQVALSEILRSLAAAMGLRRFFLPIPLKPVQAVLRAYTRVFKNTRLPVKQILELDRHEAFDISKTVSELGFDPVDFKEGLKRMFAGCEPCAV